MNMSMLSKLASGAIQSQKKDNFDEPVPQEAKEQQAAEEQANTQAPEEQAQAVPKQPVAPEATAANPMDMATQAGARAAQQFIGDDVMMAARQGDANAARIVGETAGAIAAKVSDIAAQGISNTMSTAPAGQEAPAEAPMAPEQGQAPAQPPVSPDEAVANEVVPAEAPVAPVVPNATPEAIAPEQTVENAGEDIEALGLDPNKTYTAAEVAQLIKASQNVQQ